MHIAYSTVNAISSNPIPSAAEQDKQVNSEAALRYLAYQTVCSKYSEEIACIQKYMPGWMPEFRR